MRVIIAAVWMYSFFQSFLSVVANGLPSVCFAAVVLVCLRGLCFNTYRLSCGEKNEGGGRVSFWG
jgi:hypothetical protein